MRFNLAAKLDYVTDNVVLVVRFREGSFRVDFNEESVEFYKEPYELSNPDTVMNIPEFSKESLKVKVCDKCVSGTVKNRMLEKKVVRCDGYEVEFEVEYLDAKNGKILSHYHPENVREVYLNLDNPHDGRVCGYGMQHETFAEHILAVKVIKK